MQQASVMLRNNRTPSLAAVFLNSMVQQIRFGVRKFHFYIICIWAKVSGIFRRELQIQTNSLCHFLFEENLELIQWRLNFCILGTGQFLVASFSPDGSQFPLQFCDNCCINKPKPFLCTYISLWNY